jgi:serpin B
MSRCVFASCVGLVFALLLAACSRRSNDMVEEENSPFQKPPNAEKASREDRAALARDNTRFALDLHRKLPREGNLVTSPFAVSTVLAMTLAGASEETADEMKRALRFTLDRDKLHPALGSLLWDLSGQGKPRGYNLELANGLWLDQGIKAKADFLDTLSNNYSSRRQVVDFTDANRTCRTINDWVNKQTEGRIKEVIRPDEIESDDRLVLASAVSFQGQWRQRFSPSRTTDGPFHVSPDRKVSVPLMAQKGEFRYFSSGKGKSDGESLQLVVLPFKGATMEFLVLLPFKGSDLAGLEKTLTEEKLVRWLGRAEPREVRLTLPRFEMHTQRLDLIAPLKALGMRKAFQPVPSSRFPGISSTVPLRLNRAKQDAVVVVNEKGAEGAAVAHAGADKKDGDREPEPVEFRADRPFLFLIRHAKSGTILFLGRVTDPSAG